MIDIRIVIVVMFFIILISIQFTLNKILMELREIKMLIRIKKNKGE
ncbi:MAG TPA: hypothetical protein GX396_10835 [Tissierellia bacterium]|nr:hypothetical protein [Tissierellia bacterium]